MARDCLLSSFLLSQFDNAPGVFLLLSHLEPTEEQTPSLPGSPGALHLSPEPNSLSVLPLCLTSRVIFSLHLIAGLEKRKNNRKVLLLS